MVVVIADTRHYQLIGLGRDENEAVAGLLKRWEKHCSNNPDAEPGYMQELVDEGDVQVVQLEPGAAVIYGIDD